MDQEYFKKIRILDGGMGQELLAGGLISTGTLWSATALLDEKYHELVINTHLSFIDAGADVITTNNFSARRIRLKQNNVEEFFSYTNKKACELANKAKEKSKKNILIAGGLPPQNGTYVVDDRDKRIIEKDFYNQAILISKFVDFFYLDVFSSSWEVEIASNIIEKLNKPLLVGLHIKKDGKLPSGETLTEIIKKYKSNNWLGCILSCVSLEIIEQKISELGKFNLPFGFKANLWGKEEPSPLDTFNHTKPGEIGKNPNIILGKREDITGKIFFEFTEKIVKKGATILGGCCETNPSHIKEISKLK
tara:strand:+ start:1836 stop:2753 length:918 start_codon:yes stop_codon:yes gene_type:complete